MSAKNFWISGLVFFLCLPFQSFAVARYSESPPPFYLTANQAEYSYQYADAEGTHSGMHQLVDSVSNDFSAMDEVTEPTGTIAKYALGTQTFFSPVVVTNNITTFFGDMEVSPDYPTPTTTSLYEHLTLVSSVTWGGSNNYFPTPEDAKNERIYVTYAVNLAGYVPRGQTMTIGYSISSNLLSTISFTQVYEEGLFEISHNYIGPSYRSVFVQQPFGSMFISTTFERRINDVSTEPPIEPDVGWIAGAANVSEIPIAPGDYDFDGDVDSFDYLEWQVGFGDSANLAADGNVDGVVDAADYVIWRKQIAAGGNSSVITTDQVPEPRTLFPVTVLSLAYFALRLRRLTLAICPTTNSVYP